MNLRRVLVAAAAGLLLAGCASPETAAPARPAEPRGLPDVTLEAFEGDGSLDLGALRGPVVVNLWASWCAPCRDELPFYEQFSRTHRGVRVIGIDFQETRLDEARELVRDTGVRFPLYADPDGALRAVALPKILLVDADGEVTFEKYVEIESVGQLEDLVEEHLPGALA